MNKIDDKMIWTIPNRWIHWSAGLVAAGVALACSAGAELNDREGIETGKTAEGLSLAVASSEPQGIAGGSAVTVVGDLTADIVNPGDLLTPGAGPGAGGCQPKPPIDEDRCNPEEPVPPPPVNGQCEVEILADWLEYDDGQGISEGKAEASVTYKLTDSRTGDVATTRFPSSGSFKLAVDARHILTSSLGTYTVPENKSRAVEVCAEFREHDGDVLNGDDDVGTSCTTVTLRCPQAQETRLLQADLCMGGDCTKLNGGMMSQFKILEADADRDCVPNEDDYTPDVCDEAFKGQLCRASLSFFYYGDSQTANLAQHIGTDLTKAMVGYDEVYLLIDQDQIGPFNLNPAALSLADVVMTPTEQNFFAALQDITSSGCDMDIYMFAHGNVLYKYDGTTGALSDEGGFVSASEDDDDSDPDTPADIDTEELAEDTDPANSGTLEVPIRMTYGTPCFYASFNQTWSDAGAKVTSGSGDFNFFPGFYGDFADAWDAGDSYSSAVLGEANVVDEGLSFAYLNSQGALPPWLCVGTPVTGNNACAEDFFIDDDAMPWVDASGVPVDGSDEARYAIGGPLMDTVGVAYDRTLSGEDNMRHSSEKVQMGNGAVRKNVPATLSWQ